MDGLCAGCFNGHFPQPNMKMCKLKSEIKRQQISSSWPCRLRGGADEEHKQQGIAKSLKNLDESISPMVQTAVKNARFHGINLYQGVKTLANGDCILESVIDSINTRVCFKETLSGTPIELRRIWMSVVEKIAYTDWNSNLSKQQWQEGFETQKQSGNYELSLGD